ncbi:hypothetical protein [Salininema proteolyticum]|uniref:Uncharacterized protein n=1 Tax=Salininema proteolyticum TaxID=1607685 RepID=A0ABV8TV96_9ACTN
MVVSSLRTMASSGAGVVVATHDEWVRDQCDEVVTVDDFVPAATVDA